MRDTLYLAWRYLAYHRIKTVILITSITLIVYIPVGLKVLVGQSVEELTSRADATPLLVGEKGSPLELVLNSLYFESKPPELSRYAEVTRVADSGLAEAIPLYVRFNSRRDPIVGTNLDYFAFRGLRLASGRQMAMLGDCVVGAQVARRRDLEAGDTVISSPENVFDLAGVYPLEMHVVGVLAPSYTPDDDAIFVDIKTAWIIQGLAHGHQDLSKPEAAGAVLRREGKTYIGNPSVVQYTEITPENASSFHFHGDPAGFPVTAVIVVPHDEKSGTLLMGRYESKDERRQIVRPLTVMNELLSTILTVQSFVIAAVVVVGLSTIASVVLVFALSLRLRRREIETMARIGGSRMNITMILASEVVVVFVVGAWLAAGLTLLTARFGSTAIRVLILR